ncbi:hypothetical protein NPIL_601861, partial [Nephila pilipes]
RALPFCWWGVGGRAFCVKVRAHPLLNRCTPLQQGPSGACEIFVCGDGVDPVVEHVDKDLRVAKTGMQLETCRKYVWQEAVHEAVEENEGGRDIAVAVDGSWQKRGFSSKNGVVTVTSVDT